MRRSDARDGRATSLPVRRAALQGTDPRGAQLLQGPVGPWPLQQLVGLSSGATRPTGVSTAATCMRAAPCGPPALTTGRATALRLGPPTPRSRVPNSVVRGERRCEWRSDARSRRRRFQTGGLGPEQTSAARATPRLATTASHPGHATTGRTAPPAAHTRDREGVGGDPTERNRDETSHRASKPDWRRAMLDATPVAVRGARRAAVT